MNADNNEIRLIQEKKRARAAIIDVVNKAIQGNE